MVTIIILSEPMGKMLNPLKSPTRFVKVTNHTVSYHELRLYVWLGCTNGTVVKW